MSEKQIQTKIITLLRSRGFWVFKVHGGAMQTSGIPDILACQGGQLWAFEVKRPGGVVSKIQEKRIDELRRAGARAFVVTSALEVEGRIAETKATP
jgi:Holliday junction resolvase